MVIGLQAASGQGSPARIGGYVLRRWLAQGGMAELYLATPADPARSHEIVVVKRVLPQFAQDRQFMRMFAREAQLAALLKHPNIVEVSDDGHLEDEDPEACFFAMEYVHGSDLSALLRTLREQNGSVPLANALLIAMGICGGLHHAHELAGEDGTPLGLIHRDVSPANVMLSTEGEVKITDFGVAKALALTSFTQAGTRKGKLSYMSPEQAVADPVDRRTDVFAIGAVLFELTTMQRMFGGENELAVMHKLLFRERPRPSGLMANYPPELEAIVMKATAHDPGDRYPSALALKEALEDFARRQGLAPSHEALGRFVRSVLSPPPHPAEDPEFFQSAELERSSGVEQEGTVPELAGPMTRPGGAALRDMPTALDGAVPPSPAAGAVETPAAARSVPAMPAPRLGSNPAPAAVSMATVPVPVVPAQPATVPPTSSPRTSSAGSFIAIAAGIAVLVVAVTGAVWFKRANVAGADEATAPAAASGIDVAGEPELPAQPDAAAVAQPPTVPPEVEPVADPQLAAQPDAAAIEPELTDPEPEADNDEPAPAKNKKSSKRRRGKSERKSSKSDASSNQKKDEDKPKTDKPRDPPPPPPDTGKKRKPTDTLLPIVE